MVRPPAGQLMGWSDLSTLEDMPLATPHTGWPCGPTSVPPGETPRRTRDMAARPGGGVVRPPDLSPLDARRSGPETGWSDQSRLPRLVRPVDPPDDRTCRP